MSEPATLTAAAIGAAVLTEGIKFLLASEGIVSGEVRGEVKAQRIEKGGSATGVRTGVIGQRSSSQG